MRRFNKYSALVLAVMLTMIMACATTGTKPLTAKQQAAVWMTIYNQTYDDTMAMAKNPLITPVQKEIVAKKKVILTTVWPLLKTYIAITDTGGTPTNEQGVAITDLINQLAALAGGV